MNFDVLSVFASSRCNLHVVNQLALKTAALWHCVAFFGTILVRRATYYFLENYKGLVIFLFLKWHLIHFFLLYKNRKKYSFWSCAT